MRRHAWIGVIVSLLIVFYSIQVSAADLPKLKWILGTCEPSHQDWSIKPLDVMAANLAKRTNDNWTMKVTIGNELGINREEIPMALQTGKIQMAYLPTGHIAGSMPHLNIFGLPFLIGSVKGMNADAMTINKAIEPMTVREMTKQNIAPGVFFVSTPVQLISKKAIEDMADLKGLKVRTWDESTSRIVKTLNGVPVVMPVGETYVALQRGVIDAVLTGAPAMVTLSLNEQTKYLYLVNLAPACVFIGHNIKVVEALPKEYKDVFNDEQKILANNLVEAQKPAVSDALNALKAKNIELIEIKPATMDKVKAKVKPLWGEWANQSSMCKEAYDATMKAMGL